MILIDKNARIRNKHGQTAYELVPANDDDCRQFIRQAEAEASQAADVANGEPDHSAKVSVVLYSLDSDDDGVYSDDVASD
jgi:hypothetical protein